MKHLSPRAAGWAANSALLIAGLVAAFGLSGCGNGGRKAPSPSAEDFAPYIKAYTGGIVTEDAVIRIDLTEDAAQMPTEGLFTTSPRTEGTVLWNSPSSVTYTPEKLSVGKDYSISFALGKVLKDAPEEFSFPITVKGAPEHQEQPEEEDNGKPFRVKKASLQPGRIEVVLSAQPVNAKVKGLVELTGVAKSYVQVNDNIINVHFEGAREEIGLTIDEALKDANGNTLGQSFTRTFGQSEEKPAVRYMRRMSFPSSRTMTLTAEAT